MYYCHECAIEFADPGGYDLHVIAVHSPKKQKKKIRKKKNQHGKISVKSGKKVYVILLLIPINYARFFLRIYNFLVKPTKLLSK